MDGVFWRDDMGFVVDPQHMASSFPGAADIDQPAFDAALTASGRVPPLGPAPVASWLLARLFHLTRDRLGFETHGRTYHDGGGYWLNFVAFTRDMKPAAFLELHADSTGVRIGGSCSAEFSPHAIISLFAKAILESPSDLMVCKLTTIDTDPHDLHKRRFGKPHAYGWDGSKFHGFRKKPLTGSEHE